MNVDAFIANLVDAQPDEASALRADLAEAQAQIAEWRGHHDRKDHRCFELAQQLDEARAQIAAKDAALADYLRSAEAWETKCNAAWAERDEARAQIAAKDAALELYREAVVISVLMEGPRFMGANSSALKRAWEADRAAPAREAE